MSIIVDCQPGALYTVLMLLKDIPANLVELIHHYKLTLGQVCGGLVALQFEEHCNQCSEPVQVRQLADLYRKGVFQ